MLRFYATISGSRYHRFRDCNGLNSTATWCDEGSIHDVSLREIRRRGLQPCLVCTPPPIPTVVASVHHDTLDTSSISS